MLSLLLAAQFAVVLWLRALAKSVHQAVTQNAEIELDSCVDRVLLMGGAKLAIGEIATRARNLLSGPSEAALRRSYGDAYEQTVSKRVEARRQ